jgi:hypothetical protein
MIEFQIEDSTPDDVKQKLKQIAEIANGLTVQGISRGMAIIIAGDVSSMAFADEMVRQGERPESAVYKVGSYARLQWAVKNVPEPDLLRLLPELWVDSDPFASSSAEYIALWERAYEANGNRMITDGRSLPISDTYKVYRGGLGSKTDGISWSLVRSVAESFAKFGGGRTPIKGGKVLTRTVRRSEILAFLTARDEGELIIRPAH